MILTGRQIREGRALAGLSQAELATAADVAVALVVRVEMADGMAVARKKDADAICRALEAAGVTLVPENGDGLGVRLRKNGP